MNLIFDIGEGYDPGSYTNVQLLGGSGNGQARADIVVGSGGTVASVKIVNIGNNYNYGDKLLVGDGIGADGVGFVIRITAFSMGSNSSRKSCMGYRRS